MKMPDWETNEAGPAATESSFESATRFEIIAATSGYSQNSCRGKQNASTVETLRELHDVGWQGRYVLHARCQTIGDVA